MTSQNCFEGGRVNHKDFEYVNVLDTSHWEFDIMISKSCNERYLRAFSESNGFSGSGKWFIGEIDTAFKADGLRENDLLIFLYKRPRLFYGGSHWRGAPAWADKHPRHPAYLNLRSGITGADALGLD